MRKALRILSFSAGLISFLSATILAFTYLEEIIKGLLVVKNKLFANAIQENVGGRNGQERF